MSVGPVPRLLAAVAIALSAVGARGDAAAEVGEREDGASDRSDDDARARGQREATGEIIEIEGEAPASAIVPSARELTAEAIALTPRRSPDDLLALMPGLEVSRHGAEGKGPQLFLRGLDAVHGADLEVRVAGLPINELSNIHGQGYLDLGFLIPEVVRRGRMRKGAFGLDQGRFAIAGTAEFELGVSPDAAPFQLGYEIGTTHRHRAFAVAAPPAGDGRTFVAAEAMRDSGYGDNRAAGRVAALAQSRVVLPGVGRTDVVAGAHGARFGEGGPVPLADYEQGRIGFYDTYGEGTGASKRAFVGARSRRGFGPHRLELAAHTQWRQLRLDDNFTGFWADPEHGDRRAQRHGFLSVGSRARYVHALGGPLEAEAGLEALFDRFRQTEEGLDPSGRLVASEIDLRGAHAAAAAHLGLRVVSERSRVEAGARGDWIRAKASDHLGPERDAGTALALSPRIAAAFEPNSRWRLSAGYGHGVRPPPARAALGLGGAGFSWVRSRGGDVGALYRLAERAALGLSLFGVWIPSELLFDHATGAQLEEGATRRLGIEIFAEHAPAPWLSLRADLTATHGRFVDTGEPIPGPAALFGAIEARVSHATGVFGGARLVGRGSRPLGLGAEARPVAVLDLLAAYRRGDLEVAISVDNAIGARVADGMYYYPSWFDRNQPRSELPRVHYTAGPPRMARLTLSYSFR